MRIDLGREVEFAQHRLSDILFFCEQSGPVDGDWEGYAVQVRRLIADQAREARTALAVMTRADVAR